TLSAYMRHQTHKHGEGPGHLYNSEDRGRPALGNQGRKTSSVAHPKHKYATGVDEFVFTHSLKVRSQAFKLTVEIRLCISTLALAHSWLVHANRRIAGSV